jgi:hypothetical protein
MQGSLFDTTPQQVNPYGRPVELNATVDDRDRARLSRQCLALLARLRQGPATNVELSAVAMRFGARLEELRRAGFCIEAKRGDGGVFTYRLV